MMFRFRGAVVAGAIAMAAMAADARADIVQKTVEGLVTAVNDSPFAGAPATEGISVGEKLVGVLSYDDTSGQVSGQFVSFELTSFSIWVPDTTQPDDNFILAGVSTNTATRIVFEGSTFQGLLLPENVTFFEDLSAFGLVGVDFESSGFSGPGFKFNFGSPIVEGVFSIADPPPGAPIPASARVLLAAALMTTSLLTLSRRASSTGGSRRLRA